jgi:hypothetical protein
MIKKIALVVFFPVLFSVTASVNAYTLPNFTIDPHDSLLFDAGTLNSIDPFLFYIDPQCFTRVEEVRGNVIGKVITREIVKACGEDETLYTAVERFLKKGDKLMHGSDVITSVDSKVELRIVLMESTFHAVSLKVGPESQITTPSFVIECKVRMKEKEVVPEDEIKVIKGVVTYDAEPDAGFKAVTKGKRSKGKHKKTRYSHEVKITESDTIDIIRVYKGVVEVTMENIEIDESRMTTKLEKLGEDMQSGKITPEEMQAMLTEYQNFGQNLSDLMTPLEVNEGSKCIITKNSRTVEPLGAGDEDIK